MAENGGNSRLNSALHRSVHNFCKRGKLICPAIRASNERALMLHPHAMGPSPVSSDLFR